MKQTFITLSCAALALLASACTNTDLPNEATDNNTDNTPVALSIALTGDATVSRTRSSATDIASKYLATGELTMESEVRAGIFLPALRGYIPFDAAGSGHHSQAGKLISGNKLSAFKLVDPKSTSTPSTPLYMKHLDLAAPKTAGINVLPNSANFLFSLSGNTTRTDGTAPAYSFELKHDHTKVSVLLVDPAGKSIENAAEVVINQAPHIELHPSYGSALVEEEGFVTSIVTHKGGDNSGEYSFASPANTSGANYQPDAPAHLWNTTMPISHNNGDKHTSIVSVNESTGVITPLPNGVDLSEAQLNISFDAYADANGAAMPARTYKLPLGKITLTNLPAGDPRLMAGTTNGTLKHTLSGEHLVITVKLDKDALISGTASATVGKWHIAKASTASGDANTESGQIKE